MKLIIDIPDEMYDWFENGFPDEYDYVKLWEKIKQGTPLEKELEKIKDELLSKINGSNVFGSAYVDVKDINKIFDKRIKELKGENNG